MNFLIGVIFLLIGFLFGDWKNWKNYYATILFFIMGDLIYNFVLFQHPMWVYHSNGPFLPNHTIINILNMFVAYPATVLVYLGRFPNRWKSRVMWLVLWTVFYSTVEAINFLFNGITYHNGWNVLWSVAFNVVIFLILPIHHRKSVVAWGLSMIILISLMLIFDIKLSYLK